METTTYWLSKNLNFKNRLGEFLKILNNLWQIISVLDRSKKEQTMSDEPK